MSGATAAVIGLNKTFSKSSAWAAFRQVSAAHDVELVRYERPKGADEWLDILHSHENAVVWGQSLPRERFEGRRARNILWIEYALLHQKSGVFVDHRGFWTDSSIYIDRLSEQDVSWGEVRELAKMRQEFFGGLWRPPDDPKAPILIALQTPFDAPVKWYFPARDDAECAIAATLRVCAAHWPAGVPGLVRPHPSRKWLAYWRQNRDRYFWRKEWGAKADYSKNVYDLLRRCRGLVTVNSTLATEALLIGVPVAVLGEGSFTGSGAVLDCAGEPERLATFPDYEPDEGAVKNYLGAVIRRRLDYSAMPEDVVAHPSVRYWLRRCHPERRAAVYYTNHDIDETIGDLCRHRLETVCRTLGIPLVRVGRQERPWVDIVVDDEPEGPLGVWRAIAKGAEACPAGSMVFLCEHDILYHSDHFEPPIIGYSTEEAWYNLNVVRVSCLGLYRYPRPLASQGVVAREVLIKVAAERLAHLKHHPKNPWKNGEVGMRPHDNVTLKEWRSGFCNLDIRHGKNLTHGAFPATYISKVPWWGESTAIRNRLFGGRTYSVPPAAAHPPPPDAYNPNPVAGGRPSKKRGQVHSCAHCGHQHMTHIARWESGNYFECERCRRVTCEDKDGGHKVHGMPAQYRRGVE